jgi:hypothetical protein
MDPGERKALRRKAREATLGALAALGGEARRDAIRDRALADGGFTPRELSAAPPAAVAAKHDRLVTYELSWALTNLRRDGLVENPRWGTWRLAGAALEEPVPAADAPVPAPRLAELRAMPYREYLRTPEWRRTRAAALLRAGGRCSLDVTHGEELDVHHRTYERLGTELAADLVVLCRPCHELHHRTHGRPRRERRATQPQPQRRSFLRRLLAG